MTQAYRNAEKPGLSVRPARRWNGEARRAIPLSCTTGRSLELQAGSCRQELNAKARVGAPDDAAGLLDPVAAHHQHEIVRYADLACYFQAGAGRGHVSHPAIEPARPVYGNAAALECAAALDFASFFHCCLRRMRRPRSCPSPAVALKLDGNGRLHRTPAYLSGGETDHQKTPKSFTNR